MEVNKTIKALGLVTSLASASLPSLGHAATDLQNSHSTEARQNIFPVNAKSIIKPTNDQQYLEIINTESGEIQLLQSLGKITGYGVIEKPQADIVTGTSHMLRLSHLFSADDSLRAVVFATAQTKLLEHNANNLPAGTWQWTGAYDRNSGKLIFENYIKPEALAGRSNPLEDGQTVSLSLWYDQRTGYTARELQISTAKAHVSDNYFNVGLVVSERNYRLDTSLLQDLGVKGDALMIVQPAQYGPVCCLLAGIVANSTDYFDGEEILQYVREGLERGASKLDWGLQSGLNTSGIKIDR